MDRSDPRLETHFYYPPDPQELSLEQMEYFLAFFSVFRKGFYETAWRHRQEPFLLKVDSNHILYGFDGWKFFEEQPDSSEKFEKRRAELEELLPTPGFYPAGHAVEDPAERAVWSR